MPVGTPATYPAGAVFTSTFWNTEVRDQFNMLLHPPLAVCSQATAQSTPSGAFTAVNFDTEATDAAAMHDPTTNPSQFTAPLAGVYQLVGTLVFPSSATGIRQVSWRLNGTTYFDQANCPAVSGFNIGVNVTSVITMAAGDYVELIAYQNNGSALTLVSARAAVKWESQY